MPEKFKGTAESGYENRETREALSEINRLRVVFGAQPLSRISETKYDEDSNVLNDPLKEALEGTPFEYSVFYGSNEMVFRRDPEGLIEKKLKEAGYEVMTAERYAEPQEADKDHDRLYVTIENPPVIMSYFDWELSQKPFHESGGKTSWEREIAGIKRKQTKGDALTENEERELDMYEKRQSS